MKNDKYIKTVCPVCNKLFKIDAIKQTNISKVKCPYCKSIVDYDKLIESTKCYINAHKKLDEQTKMIEEIFDDTYPKERIIKKQNQVPDEIMNFFKNVQLPDGTVSRDIMFPMAENIANIYMKFCFSKNLDPKIVVEFLIILFINEYGKSILIRNNKLTIVADSVAENNDDDIWRNPNNKISNDDNDDDDDDDNDGNVIWGEKV